MTEKQYVIFRNKCAFCGNISGTLHFKWAYDDNSGEKVYAHQRGHTVSFFECACGAVTRFERIPMITGVNPR